MSSLKRFQNPMAQSLPETSADASFPRRGLPSSPRVMPPLGVTRAKGFPLTITHALVWALAALVVMGGAFRIHNLDYGGFSEDEINKVNAIRAYERGDITANAEHPMVTKNAMFVSSIAARQWNRVASRLRWPLVPPEAALRLPNALAGAATVVPLFLLVNSFFGPLAGLLASLLLAFDVNVTGINRIGKEDTFLVFFLLLGAWLYEEARHRHLRDGRAPHRWYGASGAAFGLMLASKYMPYYLGLWAIFGMAASAEQRRQARRGADGASRGADGARGPARQRASSWFYLGIVGAFLVANPAILAPATWSYLFAYVGGHTVTHHGAFYAGRVYMNMVGATPWGLPWHFYLVYLATKVPLVILAATGVGVVELVRRRRERGAVFARVFLLFFLLPASLFAAKFARYLLPTLVVLDVVAALGIVRVLELLARRSGPRVQPLAIGAVTAVVLGAGLMAEAAATPYPTLQQNAVGRYLAAPGTMFPNDELYDLGVREAVMWIAARARPGAVIASDAPGVVGEYLRRAGRGDIEARSLSMGGLATPPTETWLLAQDSHACFESLDVVKQVRSRQRPDYVYRVRGTASVEAYRLPW